MSQPLTLTIGQASSQGVKAINQDTIGYKVPKEPELSAKGAVLAMADGISSSKVSQEASQTAVNSFLQDYYCTAETWSVNTSVQKVMKSINYWLYAQTRNSEHRYNKDKGYITTFSALVLKSNTAYLFHCGDTRIYHFANDKLACLTKDHRRVASSEVSYLTRALGIEQLLELDYQQQQLALGDIFVLATDGVYEFVDDQVFAQAITDSASLNQAAEHIIEQALANGSDDNLSVQLVRVESLPSYQLDEIQQAVTSLPLPPRLKARMHFDGYQILQELHITSRSHVFLALDTVSNEKVVIKTPSTELANDSDYLENFVLEDWIAKRINSPHVVKAHAPERKRNYLYLATEYLDGCSLQQWLIDNPKPSLNQVRDIISQIAKGLQAFHRREMYHQDIRPQNIMIDSKGTVKIIDFGSTFIAGVTDASAEQAVRGTMRYAAPEYFLGLQGSQSADIYSLAVICYQMLKGDFPYSHKLVQERSLSKQRKYNYQLLVDDDSELPVWLDDTLARALAIEPYKRYQELSEFVRDLHQPNRHFVASNKPPLMARNPLLFWQLTSLFLLLIVIGQALSD
ncbi:bifunctional protein-serine/threonine kinase/phosphatase [Endozoicomonas sp. G2_1]|uniref:bifunctional protein-serine/threonine kinase/phosphatase n=1 Tax=Endozoicomonas sp. G2_1 TaxID=2821091 RepID=UPI001ADA9EE5|nr:bifunctional protein-serine/threonine kinase/phosphatase [Endozoicomonas sp. G2_1]MBO9488833.1 bifunctional protein-serine/threonine kinase/phosphatase [Endozoicomonas sp. G2_1]